MSEQHDPVEPEAKVTESQSTVTVRRAPRYYRFMALGVAVGLVVTLVLTFAFPEQDDFSRLQVFGFTGLFIVAICAALGALVAIILDRVSRRRARTVVMDVEHVDAVPAPEDDAQG
ncbi:hypothetical protein N1031_10070 [Herbiconiux moechotypicola]|uniref:hypothetical protein n=1 Tax=Herbiconiux moechotypicola TaxID=637393 RepID=UPI00217D3B4F|nr:hypothetical protein [Herbiconiux moechotypicola]MCS5730107.1 hypothetical protein [Herbiconiux moechotypicola]